MGRKSSWGIAAGAAVVAGAFAVQGYPPVEKGSEGTVGAAKRYQAHQIAQDDVALGDTSAQAFLQSATFARLVEDEHTRALLGDAPFRDSLSNASLTEALGDPEVAMLLARPEVTKALASPAFQSALAHPGFRAVLQDSRFAEAMASQCPDWSCTSNSPIVDGAAIASAAREKPAVRRYQEPQLDDQDIALGDASVVPWNPARPSDVADRANGVPAAAATQRAIKGAGFKAALQDARFGETLGQNLNSPIVDGAAIASLVRVKPEVRRYQAPRRADQDVVLSERSVAPSDSARPSDAADRAAAQAPGAAATKRPGFKAALQDTRFAETSGRNLNSPIVDGAVIAGGK